jgi:two-component system cell cycle sensor histidine kinase/response regulator CckA
VPPDDPSGNDDARELCELRRRCADLTSLEAALRDSEDRYRRLIELLPIAVAVHREGEIVFVNPAAVTLMRATSEAQLVGTSIFEIMPPAIRQPVLERIRKAHATGEDLPISEQQFVTCDGAIIDTEVKAIPMIYGGRPAMMVLVRDVTELKRATDEKEKLERQVAHVRKLESLGVLAGGVAHDFNNILMAILGNLDLALMDLPAASPVRANLVEAEVAARRAADLSRQMLAYSGKGRFSVEPVSLNEIVTGMTDVLGASISKKALLALELAPDLPLVEADAAQIRQVVTSLVINGAEAIGDAAGTISVATDVVDCDHERLSRTLLDDRLPPGKYVRLTVADSGCGMDAGTLARVFDPFFSTKFTGRGLGLAAALGIVRGHRGAIEVQSAPGEGTRFTILLPVSSKTSVP